ncbi:Ovule protein [Caenorhabditis elegans]|uniref:Ovule protein n=1 Tax=Caenorhabditis elegans TaxID=6239 RepID=Q21196_CAEEL|nr:Ovule protein [Caenorhabditis elegans]CAA82659.1 Ovule protein [Caenorhabditis elegans]|eukprot:NP_499210.1 Uncharacterized protein CELE_K03H1.7 [Caenorhabditis elegans]
MGQSFSSSFNAKQTSSSTPQKSTKTPTCSDPRSPSQDIERTPIQVKTVENDENGSSESSTTKADKPRKTSLRQKMFARKKNMNSETDE